MIYKVEVNIYFKEYMEWAVMSVCNLGKMDIISEMLAIHNPEINWWTEEVKLKRCSPLCSKAPKVERKQIENKRTRKVIVEDEKNLRQAIQEKAEKEEPIMKKKRKVEDMVHKRFHKYLKVFGKKNSERMPMRKPWDHAIDLKLGFVPKKGKVYLLYRIEREKVRAFLDDQLRKGYICPSKSSQILLVFFVAKKNGRKRMVQDYRYINSGAIKNIYPLPLISDHIDSIDSKKVFIKLDLR